MVLPVEVNRIDEIETAMQHIVSPLAKTDGIGRRHDDYLTFECSLCRGPIQFLNERLKHRIAGSFIGVQTGLHWLLGAAVGLTWLFMARVANISSLAALISMLLAPIYIWMIWPSPALIGMQFLITLVLFWRHRSNIRNLLDGSEGRIRKKPDTPPD